MQRGSIKLKIADMLMVTEGQQMNIPKVQLPGGAPGWRQAIENP